MGSLSVFGFYFLYNGLLLTEGAGNPPCKGGLVLYPISNIIFCELYRIGIFYARERWPMWITILKLYAKLMYAGCVLPLLITIGRVENASSYLMAVSFNLWSMISSIIDWRCLYSSTYERKLSLIALAARVSTDLYNYSTSYNHVSLIGLLVSVMRVFPSR